MAVLVYAILGICHFGRMRRREGLGLAVSVFGRMIVIGIPLAVLGAALDGSDRDEFGMVLLMALKVTLIVYGVLALLSVGLTAWLADVIAPNAREWDQANDIPGDVYRQLGELGMMGLTAPAALNGSELGHVEATIVIEEIARHCGGTALMLCAHNGLCV